MPNEEPIRWKNQCDQRMRLITGRHLRVKDRGMQSYDNQVRVPRPWHFLQSPPIESALQACKQDSLLQLRQRGSICLRQLRSRSNPRPVHRLRARKIPKRWLLPGLEALEQTIGPWHACHLREYLGRVFQTGGPAHGQDILRRWQNFRGYVYQRIASRKGEEDFYEWQTLWGKFRGWKQGGLDESDYDWWKEGWSELWERQASWRDKLGMKGRDRLWSMKE